MTLSKVSISLLLLAIAAAMLSALAPIVAHGLVSAMPMAASSAATIGDVTLAEIKLPIYQPLEANGKTHAQNTHTEADDVYRSCKANGIFRLFLEPKDPKTGFTVHLLCKMDNGMGIGDWIFRIGPALLTEATAFVPKDGTMSAIETWLAGKSAVEIAIPRLLQMLGIGG